MTNRIKTYALVACYCIAVLIAGCFPEDSLEWSDDGSIGLLRVGDRFYFVDGGTGELTTIGIGSVEAWPDISRDGTQVACAGTLDFATLEEGLKALPAEQVKTIENEAHLLRAEILGTPAGVDPNKPLKDKLSDTGGAWIVRHMLANSDESLTRRLDDKTLEEARQSTLTAARLVVAPRTNPLNPTVITTSFRGILRPRFSPDGRCVAYLIVEPEDGEESLLPAHLMVACPDQGIADVHVASNVSLGFDWHPDSRALAYVRQETDDEILGVVWQTQVRDEQGTLVYERAGDGNEAPLETKHCTGGSTQVAGTLFQPLMKVAYGAGGRLFFSSASGRIPTGNLDGPTYSLFYCDPVTGIVADVLPSGAVQQGDELLSFFSLSPDGRKALLPLPKGRFAIYELGETSLTEPIPEEEGFGDDMPKMLASWKGNDAITCLVSETSHFLTADPNKPHDRKEIVLLNADGELQEVLSGSWPDEAFPQD